jgi:hypothetical protein
VGEADGDGTGEVHITHATSMASTG